MNIQGRFHPAAVGGVNVMPMPQGAIRQRLIGLRRPPVVLDRNLSWIDLYNNGYRPLGRVYAGPDMQYPPRPQLYDPRRNMLDDFYGRGCGEGSFAKMS
ncbi:hypothetical protein LSH36_480g02074 [Paralvinella palmiformis]|uniref:Uncharacterized protein n=1 Tax=Paralvinella palmiformis TaxID=53620 RepID=A0AAD9MX96_9ANNE|nr:hypothetical protein LSH36_480g02074 [Paralvinella palmiformis]